ncbi:alpha-D-ribose 1-methylphosphonate 5-triphosphate diphosphatase [Streptomyces olivochromogenes]|uniref:alpha-D-ribose 1-methylphosphonate 5-triphosphate diphosphatase n=1 Tax=Streptomyces olivochromogenes TaxID=1963 RepID=UPI001F20B94F|nr:alpha-D-ribose 1-methylphosphonate 5-triphosphate diphosphatase [Streptomyces olivochromogenes]MCF3134408.1 alpha-D-ribose 1-methylphosphonate 5-triphosphate diphosphatase [Streptomyces olivochromogenes]
MSTQLVSREGAEAPVQGWTPAAPPADYVLGHVRAVLPDRVLDDALVAVRDGRIAAVEPHPAGVEADVDGQGLLCLPGLVDVHSDGLEKELLPRPGAELPLEFALLSFEGKLRAAGVTTAFHGAAFEESGGRGMRRTLENARRICAAVAGRGDDGLVDHRILHRLDIRCPEGLAGLRQRLAELGDDGRGPVLVSHEDHTPGQGQYTDRTYYERYLVGTRGVTEDEARAYVDQLIVDRDGRLGVREEALDWLGEQARTGRIRLLGHDPGSPREIEELCERGGAVAEFPTTTAAAKAAREHGMPVVMGAPNVLRGHSHNGNASGRELVARGLVTALASDYLPSGLLGAALLLAQEGLAPLPEAVGLVTGGAADVAGLRDRGRLEPGLRADLVLAEPGRPWPVVAAVLRAACGGDAG